MSDWLVIPLAVLGGAIIGVFVITPLMMRFADWFIDHEPDWHRRYMKWAGGRRV